MSKIFHLFSIMEPGFAKVGNSIGLDKSKRKMETACLAGS